MCMRARFVEQMSMLCRCIVADSAVGLREGITGLSYSILLARS